MKIQTCAECSLDGGNHYTVDDDGTVTVTRPHHAQAALLEQAHALTRAAHEKAFEAAKAIIRDVAQARPELSSNNTRSLMLLADIPMKGIPGAAFSAAEAEGVIEPTGRTELSTDPAVRKGVNVYRSLIYRENRSVAS